MSARNDSGLSRKTSFETFESRIVFSVDSVATNVLTDVTNSAVAWGDYDNDGDLDILLTGHAGGSSIQTSALYRNTGGVFSLDVAATVVLTQVGDGDVAWGDYDLDGDLDLLLSRFEADESFLINDGAGVFSAAATPLPT